jgi:CYTH domain-containing protein
MIIPTFSTHKIQFRRSFLLSSLPEPLTRASQHLQIFDNYLTETRLRLRKIRVPETKEWTYFFEQKFPVSNEDLSRWHISQIELTEYEYRVLEIFEANEIRKNRYFFEFSGKALGIDLHLGDLWGLILATVQFENEAEMQDFPMPPPATLEVTNDPIFAGPNLVNLTFKDLQSEFSKRQAV